jgi:molybdate transport system ATP-binding protein
MASPFITLDHISIRLRDRTLFDGVSWEMLDDQHWSIVGPNGSGKSVLIKALCGSLPVAQGKVVYHFSRDGRPQNHIAYVTFESQRTIMGREAFHQARWNTGVESDALSVAEYLGNGLKQVNRIKVVASRPAPAFAAHRQAVIEQLELGALLDRDIFQLSNGERRKVLIARALLASPRLLILDNPFVGLDERFGARLKENLDALMQSEMRVFVLGTSRDEIPSGITHVLGVDEGRVVTQGPRQSVLSDHIGRKARLADRFASAADHPQNKVSESSVLVRMKNVNVSYKGTRVLDQVSWTVRESEQWALLGPNGAGKTTLLSLILADNPQAYANNITLFGKSRGSGESIWDIKQRIGWVAPELHLCYPRGTSSLDVVCSGWFDSVGLYRRPSSHQREIALAWMQRLGIAEYAETAFDRVSEGEQRLALVARALVKNPTLLVLDEPCQGLDARNRDRVLQAIDSVNGEFKTSMIYVTHRADELPASITHVLQLNRGRVVGQAMALGTTALSTTALSTTALDTTMRN